MSGPMPDVSVLLKAGGKESIAELSSAFKDLNVRSSAELERLREKAVTSFEAIATSSKSTGHDILRAQESLHARLAALNAQQYGQRATLLQAEQTRQREAMTRQAALTHAQYKADEAASASMVASLRAHWLAASAVVYGSLQTLRAGWQAANDAAQLEQQKTAFGNLAASYGSSAQLIVESLQRVSGSTVDTATLIQKAGTAMMMGIQPEQTVKLMEIARATSRQTGQDVSQAFSDIALAVGRQSNKILDNLGIIVSVERANADYATALGKTADALTDTEKRQAFFNATVKAGDELIARMGSQAETTADKMTRAGVALTNLKLQIGGVLASGVVAFMESPSLLGLGQMEGLTDAERVAIRYGASVEEVRRRRGQSLSDAEKQQLLRGGPGARALDAARAKAESDAATAAGLKTQREEDAKYWVKRIDEQQALEATLQRYEAANQEAEARLRTERETFLAGLRTETAQSRLAASRSGVADREARAKDYNTYLGGLGIASRVSTVDASGRRDLLAEEQRLRLAAIDETLKKQLAQIEALKVADADRARFVGAAYEGAEAARQAALAETMTKEKELERMIRDDLSAAAKTSAQAIASSLSEAFEEARAAAEATAAALSAESGGGMSGSVAESLKKSGSGLASWWEATEKSMAEGRLQKISEQWGGMPIPDSIRSDYLKIQIQGGVGQSKIESDLARMGREYINKQYEGTGGSWSMAAGGVIPGPAGLPSLGVAHGGEVIGPPETIVGALAEALQRLGPSGGGTMALYVDGVRLAEAIAPHVARQIAKGWVPVS